jgi:hypothetical protein
MGRGWINRKLLERKWTGLFWIRLLKQFTAIFGCNGIKVQLKFMESIQFGQVNNGHFQLSGFFQETFERSLSISVEDLFPNLKKSLFSLKFGATSITRIKLVNLNSKVDKVEFFWSYLWLDDHFSNYFTLFVAK